MPGDPVDTKTIMIGDAALFLSGVPVGTLSGAVLNGAFEKKDLSYKGRKVVEYIMSANATIEASLHEVTSQNLLDALSTAIADATKGATSIAFSTSDPLPIRLIGTQKSYLGFKPATVTVYSDSACTQTVAASDYTYDSATGEIVRAGSVITSGATVYVVGTESSLSYDKIPVGKPSFVEHNILLEAVRKADAKLFQVVLHRASISSDFSVDFNQDNFSGLKVTISALDDSTKHPTTPLGYIRVPVS